MLDYTKNVFKVKLNKLFVCRHLEHLETIVAQPPHGKHNTSAEILHFCKVWSKLEDKYVEQSFWESMNNCEDENIWLIWKLMRMRVGANRRFTLSEGCRNQHLTGGIRRKKSPILVLRSTRHRSSNKGMQCAKRQETHVFSSWKVVN